MVERTIELKGIEMKQAADFMRDTIIYQGLLTLGWHPEVIRLEGQNYSIVKDSPTNEGCETYAWIHNKEGRVVIGIHEDGENAAKFLNYVGEFARRHV